MLIMTTIAFHLTIPPEVYEALTLEAKRAKKSPEDFSVEVLKAFLLRQQKLAKGQRLLRTMPQRAKKRSSSLRADTARRHDDYLYGEFNF